VLVTKQNVHSVMKFGEFSYPITTAVIRLLWRISYTLTLEPSAFEIDATQHCVFTTNTPNLFLIHRACNIHLLLLDVKTAILGFASLLDVGWLVGCHHRL